MLEWIFIFSYAENDEHYEIHLCPILNVNCSVDVQKNFFRVFLWNEVSNWASILVSYQELWLNGFLCFLSQSMMNKYSKGYLPDGYYQEYLVTFSFLSSKHTTYTALIKLHTWNILSFTPTHNLHIPHPHINIHSLSRIWYNI